MSNVTLEVFRKTLEECFPIQRVPTESDLTIIREQLAAYAHTTWSGWMKYLFSKTTLNVDGSVTLPPWAVSRWTRQMNTEYHNLPDEEKESDRAEADLLLHQLPLIQKRQKMAVITALFALGLLTEQDKQDLLA